MFWLYIVIAMFSLFAWAASLGIASVNIPWSLIQPWFTDMWAIAGVFWPLIPVFEAVTAYLGFKVAIFFANIILGSRGIDRA